MPIQITFTGETFDHALAEIVAFMPNSTTENVEAPAKEEKTVAPKSSRRGRKPGAKTIEEEKKTSRRGRGAAKKVAKETINPLLTDALLVAHQIAEDIDEGDELVKEVLNQEYQVDNLSDLSDEQLAEVTVILTAELNAPEPEED